MSVSDWKLLEADEVMIENQDTFNINFAFEDYVTKGDPWNSNYTSFKNHIRALHSLHQVTLKIEKASHKYHYDGVTFLRPDAEFKDQL